MENNCGTFEVIETTLELAQKHPEAFAALPEAYQSDDCLLYYIYSDGAISAWAKPGQEGIIGNGGWWWAPGKTTWV